MKKNKIILLKLIESLIFVVIFTIMIISNTIYQSVYLQEHLNKQDTQKGFIQLKDNYDGKNNRISIMDFFKKPDAIEKMKKLYINVNNNNALKYYEISSQQLQYIGNFKGNNILVNGNKEVINQKIDGNIITPLKSLQLGAKTSAYLNIKNKLEKGRYFSKKDYYLNLNNEVPVVLGSFYSGTYKIGDSFEANYLGAIKLRCTVIGFLKKDTHFSIKKEYILNDKIVMPALNIESNIKNKSFEQILYSLKNNGYILYNNDNEYINITTIIDKIAAKIDIDWGYKGKVENSFKENPIKLSIKTVKSIKVLSLILSLILMVIIYILEKQIYKTTNFSPNKRERVLLQTKKIIIMALQMFVLYIITCFVIDICLKYNETMYFLLINIQRQLILFLIIGFIIINYMLNLYVKRNYKTE